MNTSRALLDVLFVLLLGVIALLFIALMHLNPPTKKSDVPSPVDIIITVEWDKKSNDDVDVWTWDMSRNTPPIFFASRENAFIHLDRDDLGRESDLIVLPNGQTKVIEVNREVVVFRDALDGEYVIALHMYAKRDRTPTTVRVSIATVNPQYKIHHEEEYVLYSLDDEETVAIFTVKNKKIIDVDTDTKIPVIIKGLIQRSRSSVHQ